MKLGWIFLALVPIVGFSAQREDDFFYIADESDQTLLHIAFDAEDHYEETLSDTISSMEIDDYDTGGLSLLEIDEKDGSLLPWAPDELVAEDISTYIERKTQEISEEFDDVFSNEIVSKGNAYKPSYEKISKERRNLFGKPRVVAVKEDVKAPSRKKTQKN